MTDSVPAHDDKQARVKERALDRLMDDTNIAIDVWDEVFDIIWDGARAVVLTPTTKETEQ